MGAALNWLKREYGSTILEIENTSATAAAAAEVLKNDPDALAVVFVNFGAFAVFLTLAQNAPAGSGIPVQPGGSVSMIVRDDLTLPARAWFASSPGGASSLYTLRLRAEVKAEGGTP